MNITQAIERYPSHLRGRGISTETASKYLYELRQLSRLLEDGSWPDYATLADWQAGFPNVCKTTLHHKVTAVKAFFRWALDMGYIAADPAAKLVAPRRPKNLPETLTDKQVEFLLHKWKPRYKKRDRFLVPRDKAMVKVFLMTGLRRAELTALNVGDVSIEGRALSVRSGKGDRDRTVIVPKNVIPELRSLAQGKDWNEPLFVGKGGARLDPNAINEMFTRKISTALGRRITPHMLRHAYATYLVNRGVPLHQIQSQLGHSSLSTTQIYLHSTQREVKDSMDVLDDLA